jgi:hypothetical protein
MLLAFKFVRFAPLPANELAVIVPVAVSLAADMLPENNALPCTPRAKRDEGVVVPKPRTPRMTFVADVDDAYMEFVVTVDVDTNAVPAAFETTNELPANDVAFVPPFDTGRVPETSVPRATWEKVMLVPSVRRTRFAVPPEVKVGAPDELVTRAEVLAVAREVRTFAAEVKRMVLTPPNEETPVPP